MKTDIQKLKTIICDLDGTLYQDEGFISIFLEHMLRGSSYEPIHARLAEEVLALLHGERPLQLGTVLDKQNFTPGSWEGVFRNSGIAIENYESYCGDRYFYLGDGWQVCFLIGYLLEFSEKQVERAFLLTRDVMVRPQYGLRFSPKMVELIGQIRENGVHTVLMTNTHREGAVDFVRLMGLERAFSEIRFGAKKPDGFYQYVEEADLKCATFLSVGDVCFNELYPSKKMGGGTVVFSPYELADDGFYDEHFYTFEQMNQYLYNLLKEKRGQQKCQD